MPALLQTRDSRRRRRHPHKHRLRHAVAGSRAGPEKAPSSGGEGGGQQQLWRPHPSVVKQLLHAAVTCAQPLAPPARRAAKHRLPPARPPASCGCLRQRLLPTASQPRRPPPGPPLRSVARDREWDAAGSGGRRRRAQFFEGSRLRNRTKLGKVRFAGSVFLAGGFLTRWVTM
uniref:Uncharacterized protein n=1 Tax=Oryza brachyantha TaxID=4533 RepID=J3MDC8_ORYBR